MDVSRQEICGECTKIFWCTDLAVAVAALFEFGFVLGVPLVHGIATRLLHTLLSVVGALRAQVKQKILIVHLKAFAFFAKLVRIFATVCA